MENIELSINTRYKKVSVVYDGTRLDRYSYNTVDDIARIIEEYMDKEIIDFCPICGEPIYEDDEVMNDNSDSYGGDCHESCYMDAQESRFC